MCIYVYIYIYIHMYTSLSLYLAAGTAPWAGSVEKSAMDETRVKHLSLYIYIYIYIYSSLDR